MTAHSTIMPTTSTRMLWADLDVESDSEINESSSDYSWFSGSAWAPGSDTAFKKQMSDSLSCATSASGDDAPLPRHDFASIPASSGTCTPRSSTSSKSRHSLRNMRLTREHLQKLQCAPSKQHPTMEDMDASSSLCDAPSTFISNTVVNSDVCTNIVQLDLPADILDNTDAGRVSPSVSQWSVGSVGHDTGSCKPCMFLFSKTGCIVGPDCQFCHFSHSRSTVPRPSKSKRDRIKRLLSSLTQEEPKEALRR